MGQPNPWTTLVPILLRGEGMGPTSKGDRKERREERGDKKGGKGNSIPPREGG